MRSRPTRQIERELGKDKTALDLAREFYCLTIAVYILAGRCLRTVPPNRFRRSTNQPVATERILVRPLGDGSSAPDWSASLDARRRTNIITVGFAVYIDTPAQIVMGSHLHRLTAGRLRPNRPSFLASSRSQITPVQLNDLGVIVAVICMQLTQDKPWNGS